MNLSLHPATLDINHVPQCCGVVPEGRDDQNSCGCVRVAESLKSNFFPKGFQLPPNAFDASRPTHPRTTTHRGSDRINVDSVPRIHDASVKDLYLPSLSSKYGTRTLLHTMMRMTTQQSC